MTDNTEITDEMLMRLADGECAPDEETTLRARIERDPDLAERFAVFAETRALFGTTGDADEAALDRLAASIRAADRAETKPTPRFAVVEGGRQSEPEPVAAPKSRRAWSGWTPAMAAALALCVGGALGYAVGMRGGAEGPSGIAVVAHAPAAERAVAAALEDVASGDAAQWSDKGSGLDGRVTLISSHRLGDQRFCREYEVATTGANERVVGVGCREADGRWRTEVAIRAPQEGEGYATASGESLAERRLMDLGSPGALTEEQEKAALEAHWR